MPFKNLIDYLEGGHSLGEFLRQFPSVTQDMAVQSLEEAKEIPARQNRVKVLLDECLPLDFRHGFPLHQAHTAEWAGFKGLKDGDLLRAADAAMPLADAVLRVLQGIEPGQTKLVPQPD